MELHPSAGDTDIVHALPFFYSGFLVSLQAELPMYLSLSADLSAGVQKTSGLVLCRITSSVRM